MSSNKEYYIITQALKNKIKKLKVFLKKFQKVLQVKFQVFLINMQ